MHQSARNPNLIGMDPTGTGRGIIFIGLLSILSRNASAQACIFIDEDLNGNVRTTNVCASAVQVTAHFGSSKSAYADAVVFSGSSGAGGFCPNLNGGEIECLAFSGDCSPTFSMNANICDTDPNAQSSEISCLCKSGGSAFSSVQVLKVDPASTESPQSVLKVDTDSDGTSDNQWFSDFTRNNAYSIQSRTYSLTGQLARHEWEDLYNGGDGDFNDYVLFYEARRCVADEWPVPVQSMEVSGAISCEHDCNNGSSCWVQETTTTDLRFFVSIGVDTLSSDYDREAPGRMLHLSVASYASSALSGATMAVCAELEFAHEDSEITRMTYGREASCNDSGNDTSHPQCLDTTTKNQILPVAFAREQHLDAVDSCANDFGVLDTFDVASGSACDESVAGLNIENYEISLAEIDARAPNGFGANQDSLSGLPLFADMSSPYSISDAIIGVRLNIIENIGNAELRCPSGVGVRLRSVSVNVAGTFAKHEIPNPDARLFLYDRL